MGDFLLQFGFETTWEPCGFDFWLNILVLLMVVRKFERADLHQSPVRAIWNFLSICVSGALRFKLTVCDGIFTLLLTLFKWLGWSMVTFLAFSCLKITTLGSYGSIYSGSAFVFWAENTEGSRNYIVLITYFLNFGDFVSCGANRANVFPVFPFWFKVA